jgi:predicted amidohydrolase YtcJ
VVTQPHFIAERGDAYRADIPLVEQECLYRAGSLLRGGVRLAGGSDAPFGGANPWAAMAAAVERRTAGGFVLGAGERLSPEAALGLFTSHWRDAGGARRRVAVGAAADLCVLRQDWRAARQALGEVEVLGVVQGEKGKVFFSEEKKQKTIANSGVCAA